VSKQTSELLRRDSRKILAEWEVRAHKEIPSSWNVTSLLMKDHFQSFLDQLADALSNTEIRTRFQVAQDRATALKFAKQHQQSRVPLSFTLAEIVLEFQIMRSVAMKVLEAERPLPVEARNLILDVFDQTVSDVAVRFAEVQNEIKEHFSLTLVHDLRAPIAVARMWVYTIQRDATLSPTTLKAAEKIDKTIERLDSMLMELLDVSRIRAGLEIDFELEEMRLDELVKETVEDMKESHGNRFELHADEPTTGAWNRPGLRRVLENLIVNALKYGSQDKPVRITLTQSAAQVELTVHNDGNPIPIEIQPTLFEKFLRASTATSNTGWGLGLALVSGMVAAHHGTVRIESSEAKGTDFIVVLPKKP
jgi:signal transduction histidine kinase